MGIEAGSSTYYQAKRGIVQDGLVLHLDAGVKESYGGAGNTWYDLSGNGNNAILINGPGFSKSQRRPSLSLDGTNDSISLSSNNIQLGTSFTLSITFEQISARSDWVRLFGHSYSSRYLGVWMPVARNWILWQSYLGAGSTVSNSYNFSLNNVYDLTVTSTSTSKTFYINGSYLSTHNLGGAIDYITNGGAITLGFAGFHTYHAGKIYSAKIYNNVTLSANEVQQNFNATRHRFGL